MLLNQWTVDYGQGPKPVDIPHAWAQEVDVRWEGPAIYETTVVAPSNGFILFHGVSYEAIVFLDGEEVLTHRGIWDGFSVPITQGEHQIKVLVTKNGGEKFPVKDVLSGFIPFVYHTFGGIYKEVEFSSTDPFQNPPKAPEYRYSVKGSRLQWKGGAPKAQDLAQQWLEARLSGSTLPTKSGSNGVIGGGKGLRIRGILSWGWYPELGHPNPPEKTILSEIEKISSLGFNCIKFCLWIPSHRYLELMEKHNLHAWIELPLWDPTSDETLQEQMLEEIRQIVRQYRRHPNIVAWTTGCELHSSTSAAYRQRLVETLREEGITGLVKDNSGSSEMYGGDLREYGDFFDFHPYCDTNFFPEVIDSLLPGPRTPKPILLGEFNDVDLYRPLSQVRNEYWASSDPALNDQGVRWQYDLPGLLSSERPELSDAEAKALVRSSQSKANFMRKTVQEHVRSRDEIAGYVLTGLRDTPISTSGILRDDGSLRFTKEELAAWNGPSSLFIIPSRQPPWRNGGNRPGWIDPYNQFLGRCHWRIGMQSEGETLNTLEWDILQFSWQEGTRPSGIVARGSGSREQIALNNETRELGEISWEAEAPGGYLLRVKSADASNTWPIWVIPKFDRELLEGFSCSDPFNQLQDLKLPALAEYETKLVRDDLEIHFLLGKGTVPAPFWRECTYKFEGKGFWNHLHMQDAWERFLPISTDRVLELSILPEGFEIEAQMVRVDTRTFVEAPVLVYGKAEGKTYVFTTLRPFGGLGNCPSGITRNPGGWWFLRQLLTYGRD